jgi:uncharacterized membrane protein
MTFLSLQHPIRWLFLAHALVGSVALLFFLVPLLSRKGSSLHVRSGWIYTFAMVAVAVSAFVITPWRALLDPARTAGSERFAVFLFFIGVFTLSELWFGLSALGRKKRLGPTRDFILIGPPVFLIALGLLVQILGLLNGFLLLILFPILTHFSGWDQLTYWLKAPATKMHWWYAHMRGMISACAATVTAFLVTAVPRIWPIPITRSPVLWIAPGLVFGLILRRWTQEYETEFGDRKGVGLN